MYYVAPCERVQLLKGGLDVVPLDYLRLITPRGLRYGIRGRDTVRVHTLSRSVKGIAEKIRWIAIGHRVASSRFE